jgi:hypothetical protein
MLQNDIAVAESQAKVDGEAQYGHGGASQEDFDKK